jgi:hypothetical protein
MLPPSSPYRASARRLAGRCDRAADPLLYAQRAAHRFVLGWAILRVAVCAFKGLDVEGFVALLVIVTALLSSSRSLA